MHLAVLASVSLTLAIAGCSGSSPTEPKSPKPPISSSPGGQGSASLTLTVPSTPLVTGGSPGTITAKVSGGTGTVGFSTDLGQFAEDAQGNPVQQTEQALANGEAQVSLTPGDTAGTAHVLAQFGEEIAKANVTISEAVLTIDSLSPTSGSPGTGLEVTINGQGFSSPLQVVFGSIAATSPTVNSDGTQITVALPDPSPSLSAGESRAVTVTVTTDPGQSDSKTASLPGGFTYTSSTLVPQITEVRPSKGPNSGNTSITILGENFDASDSRVFFSVPNVGNIPGQQIEVTGRIISRTTSSIHLTTPPATEGARFLLNRTADINVVNPDGQSATLANAFTFGGTSGSPLIISFTPTSGSYTGEDSTGSPISITLSGQGFRTDPTDVLVELAGVVQTSLQSVTNSTITLDLEPTTVSSCSPPSGPAAVTLKTTGERAVSAMQFSYTAPTPKFSAGSALSVIEGTEAGGTSVTISGSGFTASTSGVEVLFDGVRGTVSSASTTSIQVTTPAFTGTLQTVACTTGAGGTQNAPTPVDVQVINTDTGCTSAVLKRAFTYDPTDTSCTSDQPLQADFSFSAQPCDATQCTVAFQSLSTGSPTSFDWSFGDGGTDTAENPVHDYPPTTGTTYSVTLTIMDDAGNSSSVTKFVTVN